MKKSKERPERLVCYVRPQMKRSAEAAAAEMGVSTSTLVVLALRAYLEEKPKRRRVKP
jgi:antitoxin component of RelBE/YafQ-DinJ toxin-antitoxin module